jgi:outer membrane protein assembly factor BamA
VPCWSRAQRTPFDRPSSGNPLNSSDREPPQAQEKDDQPHTQLTLLPAAGGTTDIGFGVGEFGALTRLQRGHEPYLWNLESAGLVTVKRGESGDFEAPYQDVYLLLTVPRFLGATSRLEVRASYTSEATLNYAGIGNASSLAAPPGAPGSYFWYGLMHPSLLTQLRLRLADHLGAVVGVRYTQNWVQVGADSKLADDLRAGSPEVKSLLGSVDPHGVALFGYGLQWDDRDSEISPHSGSFCEAVLRLSPGGASELPFRYGEAKVEARRFLPLEPGRITLALRAVGDLQFGQPPFYELGRFDDTYAIGGLNGVRGVPAQRYFGKVKAFGNVELRVDITSFHLFGKDVAMGAVAFFDGGRVWTDTTPHPELDGTGVGLKYGVGAGLRFRTGKAFLLRADVAWSPDAMPVAGYFAAGQAF